MDWTGLVRVRLVTGVQRIGGERLGVDWMVYIKPGVPERIRTRVEALVRDIWSLGGVGGAPASKAKNSIGPVRGPGWMNWTGLVKVRLVSGVQVIGGERLAVERMV